MERAMTFGVLSSLHRCATVYISCLLWILMTSGQALGRQYCHNEVFRAECPVGQAILVTSAAYGRMSLGRCVKTDFGFVGCHVDVIDHVHRRCSGRRVCNVRVPDSTLDRERPCNEDLKSYLDVTFTCVAVAQPDDVSCRLTYNASTKAQVTKTNHRQNDQLISYIGSLHRNQQQLQQQQKQQQQQQQLAHHLSIGPDGRAAGGRRPSTSRLDPSVIDGRECGSTRKPWTVVAHPGQRIRFTVMDFTASPQDEDEDVAAITEDADREDSAEPDNNPNAPAAGVAAARRFTVPPTSIGTVLVDSSRHCFRHYATIVDLATNRSAEVCSEVAMTSSPAFLSVMSAPYTTEGYRAAVIVHQTSSTSAAVVMFLLKVEAVGCPDLVIQPPLNATIWTHRTGDRTTLGCIVTQPVHGVTPSVPNPPVTWQLFCIDGRWDGTWRNCTSSTIEIDIQDNESETSSLQMLYNGFAAAIILGVTLLVGLVVTSLGVCFMRRRGQSFSNIPEFNLRKCRRRCLGGPTNTLNTSSVASENNEDDYAEQRRRRRNERRREIESTVSTQLTDITQYFINPEENAGSGDGTEFNTTVDTIGPQTDAVCRGEQTASDVIISDACTSHTHRPTAMYSGTSCTPLSLKRQFDEIKMTVRVPAAAVTCPAETGIRHQRHCCACASSAENLLNAHRSSAAAASATATLSRRTDYGIVLQSFRSAEYDRTTTDGARSYQPPTTFYNI